MRLYEREWTIPRAGAGDHPSRDGDLLGQFAAAAAATASAGEYPVRFVVSETARGCLSLRGRHPRDRSGFVVARPDPVDLRVPQAGDRQAPTSSTCVLLVPTGVNATLGGHAGDAGPVARLFASVCDTLITHPNVVNGSDINEMPENSLYVEGSVICRLLMGTVGLQRVRSNRVLLVIDRHEEVAYTNAAINALNAARACYGLAVPTDRHARPAGQARLASTRRSGRAAGRVDNLPVFLDAIDRFAAEYDAVAVSSVIDVPPEFHQDYFDSDGDMVNPWGGVEAIFTHAAVAAARDPLGALADDRVGGDRGDRPRRRRPADGRRGGLADLPAVDPQGAAAQPCASSTDPAALQHSSVLTARDVSCLVIPDGCLGLPVLAALEQGIPVVAVRDRSHLMRNDLAALPWAPGQFCVVDNYLEAVGVLCARRRAWPSTRCGGRSCPAPVTEIVRPSGNGRKPRAASRSHTNGDGIPLGAVR